VLGIAALGGTREDRPVSTDGDPAIHAELEGGTAVEAARRAQRTGLRAFRDGDRGRAMRSFREAARLDPSYGAPRLWSALLMSHGDVNAARAWFAEADALRGGMTPANRTLLDALTPCIQGEPIDDRACEARLARAAERSPRSAYLWYELARHRWNREGPSQEAARAFDRAIEADPAFVLPRFAKGQVLAYLGRFDEAQRTLDDCLARAPNAEACSRDRIWLHAELGQCDAVAAEAQRRRAARPADGYAYAYLASTALSRGAPLETVEELLVQSHERSAPEDRAFLAARDRVLFAIVSGDFDRARADVDAMEQTVATSSDRATRLLGARLRIMIALEVGERDEAVRLAQGALARMDAWAPDPRVEDFGIARDDEMELLDVLRDGGAIDDAERDARRDAWIARWRAQTAPANVPFLWLRAYARIVDDELEAREATAAMSELGRPPYHPLASGDSGIGRMYLLTDRAAEAVPFLRNAAHSCRAPELTFGVELPWDAIRASRDLGRALEATGDVQGACAAYQRVIDRWGAARPRSVTAEDARARRDMLECP
jgi:tetratricopeptide (TPR) repeat protein